MAEPAIGVVVVARNEAPTIAACLESVLAALRPHPGARTILVDSSSSDDTVEIARRFPVEILRYRAETMTAAAGRRIGAAEHTAELVLFVDGDCLLEPGWLEEAVEALRRDPAVGVVYGGRREEWLDGATGSRAAGPRPDEYGLGGNALYRRAALEAAGSFNPFLAGEEEAELLGRVLRAGYRPHRTAGVMITHRTVPKASGQEFLRRARAGMTSACGQVLRLSIGQGLFAHHARRFNRYLATLGFLVAGAGCMVAALGLGSPAPLLGWLAVAGAGFALLALKRGSLAQAAYIATDWLVVAVTMVPGLLARPRPADSHRPRVERIQL